MGLGFKGFKVVDEFFTPLPFFSPPLRCCRRRSVESIQVIYCILRFLRDYRECWLDSWVLSTSAQLHRASGLVRRPFKQTVMDRRGRGVRSRILGKAQVILCSWTCNAVVRDVYIFIYW